MRMLYTPDTLFLGSGCSIAVGVQARPHRVQRRIWEQGHSDRFTDESETDDREDRDS